MKMILEAKQFIKKMILLVYYTCTNDIIIYSKQASNIELFILAFFIECNRLFIADSVFINVVQKHFFDKLAKYYKFNRSLARVNWMEIKNATSELVGNNGSFINLYHKDTVVNQ